MRSSGVEHYSAGESERAVYDPDAHAFHHAEMGALLADEAARERAGDIATADDEGAAARGTN